MKSCCIHLIVHAVAMAIIIVATISPIHAASRPAQQHFPVIPSSPFSQFISDLKSVRLIQSCRQYISHLRQDLNLPTLHSTPDTLLPLHRPRDGRDKIAKSYENIPKHSHLLQDKELNGNHLDKTLRRSHSKLSTTSDMYPNSNDRFPAFSSVSGKDVETYSDKRAFEFMEQICLKYAFDKLLQSQNKERYFTSKKALQERNHVTRMRDSFPLFDVFQPKIHGVDNNEDDEGVDFQASPSFQSRHYPAIQSPLLLSTRPSAARSSSLIYNDDGLSLSNPALYNNNNNNNNINTLLDLTLQKLRDNTARGQEASPRIGRLPKDFYLFNNAGIPASSEFGMTTIPKVGNNGDDDEKEPRLAGLMGQTRGKRRHRLSINNHLMTITSKLMAEDQRRLQRNRNNVIRHMITQG